MNGRVETTRGSAGTWNMWWVVLLIVIGAGGATAAAVVVSFRWMTDVSHPLTDDFTKVAAVWAGLVTAVLTASFSLVSTVWQARAGEKLEATKRTFESKLEDVRLLNQRALEFTRGRYAAERKAYDELLGAVYTYYYTLSPLEAGAWNEAQSKRADDAMIGACRYLVAADQEHRDAWVDFWQTARSTREEARAIRTKPAGGGTSTVEAQRTALWNTKAKGLAGQLKTFESAAAAKHRQADAATQAASQPVAVGS